MRKRVFFSVLAFLVLAGCGAGKKPRFTEEELARIPFPQRGGLPECSGGFVLAVRDKTITADEIVLPLLEDLQPIAQSGTYEQFKERAGKQVEQVVTTRVLNILLYNEARKDAPEGFDEVLDELAEAEMKKFFAGFGGDDAKADQALKQTGMTRASYKEYLKMMILNQSYMASKVSDNTPITYSELLDSYNQMKDESFVKPPMIKFQVIDIELDALELNDPNQDRLEHAQKLADELKGRMEAGEDLSTLAKKHSGVSFIPHVQPVRPESLLERYHICAIEAEKMSPGQIKQIPTGDHIIIMELEGKWPKSFKPLEEVQEEVERKIIFERRQKAVAELEAELLQQAELGEKDAFVDFCLKKIYRMSNQ